MIEKFESNKSYFSLAFFQIRCLVSRGAEVKVRNNVKCFFAFHFLSNAMSCSPNGFTNFSFLKFMNCLSKRVGIANEAESIYMVYEFSFRKFMNFTNTYFSKLNEHLFLFSLT